MKFAYPHGHDELLMIALDNKTKKQTLLRTVPDVTQDGSFREFLPHQVYKDSQGFPVTKADDYEMVMVHHHPLQRQEAQHGMGNYLLYMTPGACPTTSNTTTRQVATTHASFYLAARSAAGAATFLHVSHALLPSNSVQFCSSSKSLRAPLPKKEPIPSHVDWVSHLRLCYSHLHSQTRAPSRLQQKKVGAGVSQIT